MREGGDKDLSLVFWLREPTALEDSVSIPRGLFSIPPGGLSVWQQMSSSSNFIAKTVDRIHVVEPHDSADTKFVPEPTAQPGDS